jgi:phosphatidylinositol glycan class M
LSSRFIACTVLVCVSLGAASYLICGREYLDAAVLYHLTRLDHRHNFSPHFLQVLIGKWVDEAALRRDLMLTSSLPQVGSMM